MLLNNKALSLNYLNVYIYTNNLNTFAIFYNAVKDKFIDNLIPKINKKLKIKSDVKSYTDINSDNNIINLSLSKLTKNEKKIDGKIIDQELNVDINDKVIFNIDNIVCEHKIYDIKFKTEPKNYEISSDISCKTSFRSNGISQNIDDKKLIKLDCISKYSNADHITKLIDSIKKFPLYYKKLENRDLYEQNNDNIDQFNLFNDVDKLPSVKTILRETASKESLMKLFIWRKKMIKQMGTKPFVEYNRSLIKYGSNLHSLLEKRYKGQTINENLIPDQNKGHWKSLQNVFDMIPTLDIHEKSVTHPYLGYTGIVDALGTYENSICAIEWKTSVNSKPNLIKTMDTPLQVAAYIGALNFEPNLLYNRPIKNAVIVIAYQSGDPADLFYLPHEITDYYWQEWLFRLSTFWSQKLNAQFGNTLL
ncbi:unnamed protein product [Gordionus sp. m RMFG-2023]|uniref:uncharacterized protein LOC135928195 isoform X1 n=1 Tax=Gordionus sp. m RMFG-2023 TaxID=3053472 RepID=UPI0030E4556C